MVQPPLPLAGRTIVLTRPRGQAKVEADLIRKNGGISYYLPTIEIKAPSDLTPIKAFIENLSQTDAGYVVFMSVNGVTYLVNAAQSLNQLALLLAGLKKATVVAVGPRTAQELQANKIHVDLIPSQYTSEGVLEVLRRCGVGGRRVYIPRTPAAGPILAEQLKTFGALVDEIYVYTSEVPLEDGLSRKFLDDLQAGKIDAIIFGSSLCVKNLFKRLSVFSSVESVREALNGRVVVVAVGSVTAKTLSELGVMVDVVPEVFLFEAALAELVCFWKLRGV
jgi:uroporphyrinogen-III synthase